jgi:hypothetical protein
MTYVGTLISWRNVLNVQMIVRKNSHPKRLTRNWTTPDTDKLTTSTERTEWEGGNDENFKLCKDCKHCIPDKSVGLPFANCARKPVIGGLNYHAVNGESGGDFASCAVQRSWGWFLARIYLSCGKEGRYWEAK